MCEYYQCTGWPRAVRRLREYAVRSCPPVTADERQDTVYGDHPAGVVSRKVQVLQSSVFLFLNVPSMVLSHFVIRRWKLYCILPAVTTAYFLLDVAAVLRVPLTNRWRQEIAGSADGAPGTRLLGRLTNPRATGTEIAFSVLRTLYELHTAMKHITETNRSTLIGLVGGLLILILTAVISRTPLGGILNLPGLLMVLGGSLAATLVSRPVRDVVAVLKSLRGLVRDEPVNVDHEIARLSDIAYWYRSGNIRAAEQAVQQVGNPLLRTGAQLVIDREPINDIVKVLQWRIAGVRTKAQGDVQILRTLAAFAPVFGMLGTLFGLIRMLNTLGHASLADIGAAMSFALITTLYGLILANLIFKPLAMKLERRIQHQVMLMNMVLEGIVLLHERRHPTQIKEALTAYPFHGQGSKAGAPPLARVA